MRTNTLFYDGKGFIYPLHLSETCGLSSSPLSESLLWESKRHSLILGSPASPTCSLNQWHKYAISPLMDMAYSMSEQYSSDLFVYASECTEHGDGVAITKRQRQDFQSDVVIDLAMKSGREAAEVEMHRGIAWDKVENPNPQSTQQVLPSFEEYTPPMTYPEEVEETIGIPMEVEPLHEPQLEDLGLNTCNHDIPLSSREVPSFDEPKPQPQPLPNCPPLDVNLGDKRGTDPPIKPHSPKSFRMNVVDKSAINTPPSPHVTYFHPKDTYCYYRPCIDDPKKHYGFKPGLLGQSRSLGVII
ncbi:hypothetical protein Tco_0343179 [Tanacetum coccineum]